MKRFVVTLAELIIVAFAASAVVAEPNEALNFQTVTITNVGGALVATPPGPFAFTPGPCDRLNIINSSGAAITVTNTTGPGVTSKPTQVIAIGGTGFYDFCCPDDRGIWAFTAAPAGPNPVSFEVRVQCVQGSSLTPFGVAALLLLLAGTTMWMLKRRTAGIAA